MPKLSRRVWVIMLLLVAIGVLLIAIALVNRRALGPIGSLLDKYQLVGTGGLPSYIVPEPAPSGAPSVPTQASPPPPLTPEQRKEAGFLEKSYNVEVTGVLTVYPKFRGATNNQYLRYLVAEDGQYKGQEFTLDFYALTRSQGSNPGATLGGRKVRVSGSVFQEFVDPALPNSVQRAVNVKEITPL